MQVLISRPTLLAGRLLPAGLVLELVEAEARRLIALGHAVAAKPAAMAAQDVPAAPVASVRPESPRSRRRA